MYVGTLFVNLTASNFTVRNVKPIYELLRDARTYWYNANHYTAITGIVLSDFDSNKKKKKQLCESLYAHII